jgi:septum site-determining protein MinC
MPPEASSSSSSSISQLTDAIGIETISDETPSAVTESLLTSPPEDHRNIAEAPLTGAENSELETPTPEKLDPPPDPNRQVRIKTEKGKVWIILPSELKKEGSTISYAWSELIQQIQQRLSGDARTWSPQTPVRIMAGDRLLDTTQVQELVAVLKQANLRLKRLYTSRRQTAVAVATSGFSVEQHVPQQVLKSKIDESGKPIADPLYVQMTLRSGAEIRHDGSVIVLGDMNPGSSVIAEGDILVWGKLRGLVHAGSGGNAGAIVMATQMQPAQIRIADFVARGPSNTPTQFLPEVAYVTPQGKISIAPAQDFTRPSS